MTESADIMVVASSTDGYVDPEAYDLIAFGRSLQDLGAGTMAVWLLGADIGSAADEIARRAGINVFAIQGTSLRNAVNETYGAVLADEVQAAQPSIVCAAHTSSCWEWAPALAARIGGACICGVDGIEPSPDRIAFRKDIYGGKLKGLYASTTTTVVTVQPGIFRFSAPPEMASGTIVFKTVVCPAAKARYVGLGQGVADATDINAAPILVAVGNGIGDEENMQLIHHLAGLLPKAVVAGTRIVCDRGWLGYSRQVGVTGASVAPALYIACGISGAPQHVMGMRGAKFVVAINTDPHAPIFNEADIGIVEDITGFIPLFKEAYMQSGKRSEPVSVDMRTPEEE
jgi:electron transfer flavoprotein alpha subunit